MSEIETCQTCGFNGAPPNLRLKGVGGEHGGGISGMAWFCSNPECRALIRPHTDDAEPVSAPTVPAQMAHRKLPAVQIVAAPVDFMSQARARMDEIRLQLAQADSLRAELKMLEKFFGVKKTRRKKPLARKTSPRLKAVGA